MLRIPTRASSFLVLIGLGLAAGLRGAQEPSGTAAPNGASSSAPAAQEPAPEPPKQDPAPAATAPQEPAPAAPAAQEPTAPAAETPNAEAPKAEEEKVSALQIPESWGKALDWRSIGPVNQGGRTVDIEVDPSDRHVWYVASASGGLWKTANGGTTFEPIFEKESAISIGDVALAPSDSKQIWVGTGEANVRNSASWGDGVWKSIDAGKTWKHMGLPESRHIGRIVVHPKNPDVVYVAALGRLWGTNPERGLYKTTDGGQSWNLVLAVDEKTGCNDVVLSPEDPEVLLASMYERQRDATDDNDPIKRFGPGAGIYRSKDGGATWERIAKGLPTVPLGCITFDWYEKDPKVVFAIVESERWGMGKDDPEEKKPAKLGLEAEEKEEGGGVFVKSLEENGPAAAAGVQVGDKLLKVGEREIERARDVQRELRRRKEGDETKLELLRGEEKVAIALTYGADEPKERRPHSSGLGGQNPNIQEKQGDDGFETGGVFRSDDGGQSWTRVNSLNPRPYYFSQIRVDPSDAQHLFVLGTQLHGSSDGGKTFGSESGNSIHLDHHAMWIDPADGRHMLVGNDGGIYESHDRAQTWRMRAQLPIGQFYHVALDPRRDYRAYGGLQDNGTWGGPTMLRSGGGPTLHDWFQFGGGDGFVCAVDPEDPDIVYYESQNGGMGRTNLRTGEGASIRPRGEGHRFNWKTPFQLSAHNGRIFYCAGNKVFRSLNRGANLKAISPEITLTDKGSATAFAESPRDPDVLYVGTDDGALKMTKNGGTEWVDVGANLPELPGPRWVSSIECSRAKDGRAYLTLDGHRSDDLALYVYVTEDFGKKWKRLAKDLPDRCARVIREDRENPNVLYLGTEYGSWASADRGASWVSIKGDMPTVPVHELAQHPLSGELVAATHGRSLWIVDITPIRQAAKKTLEAKAQLFTPAPAVLWARTYGRRLSGDATFHGENPSRGALLSYALAEAVEKAELEIRDLSGAKLRSYKLDKDDRAAGLHRRTWDLRASSGEEEGANAAEGGEGEGRRRRPRGMREVEPGRYRAVLLVDEKEVSSTDLEVVPDPRPTIDVGTGFVPASPIR
ncbi:MAG: PDZ domain-containing protein [Planctomycetes bacterium]|nr:PDZ domain-containing protein [Planctomycetota bacterium]